MQSQGGEGHQPLLSVCLHGSLFAQLLPFPVVRQDGRYLPVEGGGVILVEKVAQLMHHHILNEGQGVLAQTAVEVEGAVLCGTTAVAAGHALEADGFGVGDPPPGEGGKMLIQKLYDRLAGLHPLKGFYARLPPPGI